AIERNNLEAIKIAEKAVVTSHPASPHHHKDKEILPKALKDYYLKAICFAFFKMSIILTILLLAFLLFRNCSFESQQEPTVQTVVETKVAEPTKEIWNTEKVTAVKSSLNGCETLTNAANFKTEWEKNLENAKINEAKQIVIPSVGVLFELGSSVVSEEGRKLIQEFASAYLQTNKEVTVLIESYTCDIGTDENNMTLSNDRANVIKAVLENMGVTSVEVKSYGESTYNDLSCKSKEEHRRGNISVK
ncbi:OmpA family protein, partial [Capnocytophaga leadbetteri]|uniref:OmpA family protein n=3 Tax=Flavobacteriaceae TaxID=49546 RepID=UPI00288BC179